MSFWIKEYHSSASLLVFRSLLCTQDGGRQAALEILDALMQMAPNALRQMVEGEIAAFGNLVRRVQGPPYDVSFKRYGQRFFCGFGVKPDYALDTDVQSGFFLDLADGGLVNGFARFYYPAGQAPELPVIVLLDQQDRVIPPDKDQRNDHLSG